MEYPIIIIPNFSVFFFFPSKFRKKFGKNFATMILIW
jgi:hypothetical protein